LPVVAVVVLLRLVGMRLMVSEVATVQTVVQVVIQVVQLHILLVVAVA
jgi:hypothetical protein